MLRTPPAMFSPTSAQDRQSTLLTNALALRSSSRRFVFIPLNKMVCPSEGFEPLATPKRLRQSAARRSTACRRCSSLKWTTSTSRQFDLTSLRTGMMAGSPCPGEVMKRACTSMHLSEIVIGYGMTETSPASFASATDDTLERRVSTVGRVFCRMSRPRSSTLKAGSYHAAREANC